MSNLSAVLHFNEETITKSAVLKHYEKGRFFGTLNISENLTLFFNSTSQIDPVIAELIKLKKDFSEVIKKGEL